MNASAVVAASYSRGWVKLHTVVVHKVMVDIEVGAAVPIVAVTHTMKVLAIVRIVLVVADQRMMTVVGSGHCSSVIPSGICAVLLLNNGSLYQVGLICSILKRCKAEFLGHGVFLENTRNSASLQEPVKSSPCLSTRGTSVNTSEQAEATTKVAQTKCYLKMLRGRYADTIQLGASTISLIFRSTAAPHRQ